MGDRSESMPNLNLAAEKGQDEMLNENKNDESNLDNLVMNLRQTNSDDHNLSEISDVDSQEVAVCSCFCSQIECLNCFYYICLAFLILVDTLCNNIVFRL